MDRHDDDQPTWAARPPYTVQATLGGTVFLPPDVPYVLEEGTSWITLNPGESYWIRHRHDGTSLRTHTSRDGITWFPPLDE